MKRYLGCCFLFACFVAAQVSAPNVGSARFAGGRVFAVHGIPANLLVAQAPWIAADAVSFSDAGGLLSRNGTLTLVGPDGTSFAAYASGEPAPVLNIDGLLSSAIAWLPSKHALLNWSGAAFLLREVNDSGFAGKVTCIQLTSPQVARLLVTHSDTSVSAITISVDTGEIISSDVVPAAHGFTFAQGPLLLSEDPHGLAVESTSGVRRSVTLSQDPLPDGDLTLERMSTDWLHIASASTGGHWALYLTGESLRLSLLPVPPANEAAQ